MYSAYMQRDPLGDIVIAFVGLFILVVAVVAAAAAVYVVVLPFMAVRAAWRYWRKPGRVYTKFSPFVR